MKNKKIIFILFISFTLTIFIVILNIKVITKQGINYEVISTKIPLYLKILNFFDRHYNYKDLVKQIVKDTEVKEEKVLKIFKWTYEHIKAQPVQLPVIDDHVWNIIIRGYGVQDQYCDVFSTLCNYIGTEAFFDYVYTKDSSSKICLSFVRFNKRWYIFDPYRGIYFKDNYGHIADLEEIKNGNWRIEKITQTEKIDFDYKQYFQNLPIIKEMILKRSNIQSPLRRFIFTIKNWIEKD
jgi:hypothetical protein